MYCGCPLLGDTIGQHMARLVRHVVPFSPPYAVVVPSMHPLAPPRNADGDMLLGTHPSDHDAVLVTASLPAPSAHGMNMSARERRVAKLNKRVTREEKKAWRAKEKGEYEKQRAEAHDHAFLVPIPLNYVPVSGCVESGYYIFGTAVSVGPPYRVSTVV